MEVFILPFTPAAASSFIIISSVLIEIKPFGNFFILFCFRYSVFFSPFLSSPEECDRYLNP